jgi:serine/threonine-protein kinase
MVPCTPIYAAPEQLINNKNLIDPRTDFFGLGIIALELYLGGHPFDPVYVGNQYSIVENIMQNKYAVETGAVKRNEAIVELASRVLQTQPYDRFRNYQMLNTFIAEQI